MKFRRPAVLTVVGVSATLGVTAVVIVVLLLFGGGARAVSDNAALIGALVALGGVFTTQLVNSALEAQRAELASKTEQEQLVSDSQIEQQQRMRELEVESQHAQYDAVQAYLDQMAALLLDEARPLRQSKEGDEVRTLARARTLTVLSRLDDAILKGTVVQFLYESDLITHERPLVRLMGANLSMAALIGVSLSEADLSGANLFGANLSMADLSGANLSGANLNSAFLGEADLSMADLSRADLTNAKVADEPLEAVSKLEAASTLEGATMPNGRKYKD